MSEQQKVWRDRPSVTDSEVGTIGDFTKEVVTGRVGRVREAIRARGSIFLSFNDPKEILFADRPLNIASDLLDILSETFPMLSIGLLFPEDGLPMGTQEFSRLVSVGDEKSFIIEYSVEGYPSCPR